ncbi:MAG: molybdate ABC transporter substrate-binding protein [Rhodospirillales bacterium]|nr:molybdate ABC transporter substrate-binding protein [Rhodospirillales bacterium]
MRAAAPVIAIFLISAWAATAQAEAQAERVLVFAAASLKLPLAKIARAHEKRAGHDIDIAFAASSALARQIAHGAPADIFVSAHLKWMDWLEARGKIEKSSKTKLLTNSLVIVAPAGSQPEMDRNSASSLLRVLGADRLAIADPAHVPAGIYGKEALQALGVWPQISRRLARTVNVRAALALIERRALPLGIVYGSDAHRNPLVDIVYRFPAQSHVPIQYIAATVKDRARPATAAFLAGLRTEYSKNIFDNYGFKTD